MKHFTLIFLAIIVILELVAIYLLIQEEVDTVGFILLTLVFSGLTAILLMYWNKMKGQNKH